MSLVRWATTTAAMTGVAWLLAAAGPGAGELRATVTAPQAAVDAHGPDALLVVLAAALAWLVWTWGAAGLLLTALSALPGLPGRIAGVVAAVVLPGNARRAAALALGLSLSATAPLAVGHARGGALPPAAVAVSPLAASAPVLDWPAAPAGGRSAEAVPDWPTAPGTGGRSAGAHVVAPGDCLWDVAAARLRGGDPGRAVPAADVARAVDAWWRANAEVIGPDPDLLLPGQVLRPPTA